MQSIVGEFTDGPLTVRVLEEQTEYSSTSSEFTRFMPGVRSFEATITLTGLADKRRWPTFSRLTDLSRFSSRVRGRARLMEITEKQGDEESRVESVAHLQGDGPIEFLDVT